MKKNNKKKKSFYSSRNNKTLQAPPETEDPSANSAKNNLLTKVFNIFSSPSNNQKDEKDKPSGNKAFLILTLIVIVLLLSGLIYMYKMYADTQKQLTQLQAGAGAPTPNEKQTKELISKLGQHYILPEEQPKVIILSNVDSLKEEQRFFEVSKDGDILYIYQEKVILYDPIKDRIIDIAQIRTEEPTSTPSPTEEPTPTRTARPTRAPTEAPEEKPTPTE